MNQSRLLITLVLYKNESEKRPQFTVRYSRQEKMTQKKLVLLYYQELVGSR